MLQNSDVTVDLRHKLLMTTMLYHSRPELVNRDIVSSIIHAQTLTRLGAYFVVMQYSRCSGIGFVRISRRRQYALELLQHIQSPAGKRHLRAVHLADTPSLYVDRYKSGSKTRKGRWRLLQTGFGPLEDETVRTVDVECNVKTTVLPKSDVYSQMRSRFPLHKHANTLFLCDKHCQ